MNRRLVLSGIFLLQLFFQLSMAQETDVLFTKIVGNNGETLFKITAITQDPKGYMWFSGQNSNSLYRYDGYHMISFKHDTLNENSLGGLDLEGSMRMMQAKYQ